MGIRGRRPVTAFMKAIKGNPGHRPIPTSEPVVGGAPVKPAWLTGRGTELWDEVLEFAPWLTLADSYKFAAWCDQQSAFEGVKSRRKWTNSDRREHRAAATELGLDPKSRARMG